MIRRKDKHPEINTDESIESTPPVDTRELSEYIRDEARSLLRRLDADLVQHLADIQSPRTDELIFSMRWLDYIVRHRDVFEHPDATKRSELEATYYTIVEQSRVLFENLELLCDAPSQDVLIRLPNDDGFETAHEVYKAYRGRENDIGPFQAEEMMLAPAHDWAINLDEEQDEALTQYLRSLDVYREVERLEVTGLELLHFSYDEQRLRAFLTKMPAIAFEGLTGIDFAVTSDRLRPIDEAENEQQATDIITAAHHVHNYKENTARITVYVGTPNWMYDKFVTEGTDKVVVEAVAEYQLNESIAHEVGHALHYTLPVALLHDWETAIASENTVDITEYVGRVRASGNQQSHAMERFAETFAMFYDWKLSGYGAEKLVAMAPDHFEAMLKILRRTGAADLAKIPQTEERLN